jgi:hypothetical protein
MRMKSGSRHWQGNLRGAIAAIAATVTVKDQRPRLLTNCAPNMVTMGRDRRISVKSRLVAGVLSVLLLGLASAICVPGAIAQNNLGDLLDAGAKMLSAEEFKDEVVQRSIVGPTAAGGHIEVLYSTKGTIQGMGIPSTVPTHGATPIYGDWKVDENGKICTSMVIGDTNLPYRCQSWFKSADKYFVSDSDSDRRARVLVRTVKP